MNFPPKFALPLTPSNYPVSRCPVGRAEASHRILILRTGAFGDILMGTPLLSALRRAYPRAHLTWVAEHKEAQAVDAHPCVDEVLKWDGAYWKNMLRRGLPALWLLRALRFQRALREKRYDVFVSLQGEEWPLLVRGVGAATTIGVFDTFRQFAGAEKTSRYAKLYTHAFTFPNLPEHRTDQYLLPLQALGVPAPSDKRMRMGFTREDAEAADAFLRASGLEAGRPFVVMAPMTTWPSRCWPAERFAGLGDLLTEPAGSDVVLIGSPRPAEKEAVAAIAAQMKTPPALAAGALTFRQMAALIARSVALVSGDTGPMHVAAAVGTPYVALFGPTPVLGRVPLVGRGRALMHPVPCGPCDRKVCPNPPETFLRCMKLLTVEEVFQTVAELLPSVSVR